MKIAVASGKGGTGKTSVAVNLAALITDHHLPVPTVFLDCDVEAPNAALFFNPEIKEKESVDVLFPHIDQSRCDGCGQCVDICHYHALTVTPKRLVFFPELCHSCGGCAMVCSRGAIDEKPHRLGKITSGSIGSMHFIQGEMDIGNSSPVAIINSMMNRLEQFQHESPTDPICIIDAPPGVSCPVVASLRKADFVLLVTEPTPFGLHDLQMAVELVQDEMSLPLAVILNKDGLGNKDVENYCKDQSIPVIQRIPFSRKIAEIYARGDLLIQYDEHIRMGFEKTWAFIQTCFPDVNESEG